jgi:gliding motility-associated protein GldM
MSIPKEPRQLMINLMYLVLTALLALNVSAEVMNAFFSLDKGMKDSRAIVEKNNVNLIAAIEKAAKDYPSPQAEDYKNRALQSAKLTTDFVTYIEEIRNRLFEKAGGANPKIPNQPKDIRNKDITTKMFVNDGLGNEIMNKITETRNELAKILDNDKGLIDQLSLAVEELPAGTKAANWSEFKFKQMPVSAVFPILGKIQSDAKSSSTAVLNYCLKKVGGEEDVKFDNFQPGVAAKKNYVILGETFEADVFMSAFSSKADNVTISVDGRSIPLKDGIGAFSEKPGSIGEKKFTVVLNVKNPTSGQTTSVKKEFSYEVGQRSVAIQLDKMNVFYIGVDNPISVSAAGVPTAQVKVSAGNGLSVSAGGGSGKFVVRASTPGESSITVSGGGVSQTFPFRVKRIPDPYPRLGGNPKNKGGTMGNGEFKAQGGIAAILEGFDFDAKCDVVGFEINYLPKRQDVVTAVNSGARWNSQAAGLIEKAKPGDTYFFDDVKCKCPGDAASRNIGTLTYKIK